MVFFFKRHTKETADVFCFNLHYLLYVHTRKKIVSLNSLLLASIPSVLSPFRMVYDSIFDREFSNIYGRNEWMRKQYAFYVYNYIWLKLQRPFSTAELGIAFWRGGGMSMAQYNILFTYMWAVNACRTKGEAVAEQKINKK